MPVRQIDPVDAEQIAIAWEKRGLVWLDSDGSAPYRGWSYLGCDPVEVRSSSSEPFELFDASGLARDDEALFAAVPRWVGYLAYDAAWAVPERLGLRRRRALRPPRYPLAQLLRFDAMVAIAPDGASWLVADNDMALDRLASALELVRRESVRDDAITETTMSEAWVDASALHAARIENALERIRAGDLYQVNLARKWSATLRGSSLGLFRAMRRASPVPFGCFWRHGEVAIASRSMERFLRWDRHSRTLETRPIKGTIPRGAGVEREAALLRSNPKERAEHAMIVDLMRNDFGRIARPGSVQVVGTLEVEPYAKLSHLVSTIRATTCEGIGASEILGATFPPASITGAPKLKAIECIETLEAAARGVYCGAIGWIDRSGGLSLAVGIRTALIEGESVDYWAGGGIVDASRVGLEVAETELKARVFLDAIEILAQRGVSGRVRATKR